MTLSKVLIQGFTVAGDYQMSTGGSVYDGRQQVLYWADVSSEVAFVVPSNECKVFLNNSPGGWYHRLAYSLYFKNADAEICYFNSHTSQRQILF